MKSLSTLIKLQKTRVDEQRLLLIKLQDQLGHIENAIIELELQQAREQVAAEKDPVATRTYGAFVKASIKHGRELERQRQIGEAAVEAARQQLTTLFEEQKRYEIAETTRMATEEREELRRERMELDEIGSVTHIRKSDQ